MEIFISWSGRRSRVFAADFKVWIRCVLQAARPWISTDDIPGGSVWFNEISEQLANTTTGIICLTKENFRSEWILFESGALFKGLPSNRLHTILIDLQPGDVINSPLSQLNHADTTEAGMHKLVRDLNRQMGDHALDQTTLDRVFKVYWPQFKELHERALNELTNATAECENIVSDRQLLEEILSTIRTTRSLSLGQAIERHSRVKTNPALSDINSFLSAFEMMASVRSLDKEDLSEVKEDALRHLDKLENWKSMDSKEDLLIAELKSRLSSVIHL
jgi:hypothetical protein